MSEKKKSMLRVVPLSLFPENTDMMIIECCPGAIPEYVHKKKDHLHLHVCPYCGFTVGNSDDVTQAVCNWNKTIITRDFNRISNQIGFIPAGLINKEV